jgi:hypothetical protein
MVFVAEDDQSAKSNPVKLIITVQPINDPPTVNTSDMYTLIRTSNNIARTCLIIMFTTCVSMCLSLSVCVCVRF